MPIKMFLSPLSIDLELRKKAGTGNVPVLKED